MPKLLSSGFFPQIRLHPEKWWQTDFRYGQITGTSSRRARGLTYSIGDLYFMDLLKGHSVKKRQLPVSLVFLHRRPRDEKLIVWAETAVGPFRNRQTQTVQNPKHTSQEFQKCMKTKCLTLQSSWWAPWLHWQVVWSSVCPTLWACHRLESGRRRQVNWKRGDLPCSHRSRAAIRLFTRQDKSKYGFSWLSNTAGRVTFHLHCRNMQSEGLSLWVTPVWIRKILTGVYT